MSRVPQAATNPESSIATGNDSSERNSLAVRLCSNNQICGSAVAAKSFSGGSKGR